MKNFIKEPTCYKNLNKPSYIDLILTSKPQSFQQSCVIEADPSVFCKMKTTVLKTFSEKLHPIVVNYIDHKYFENDRFRADLLSEFREANIEEKENGLSN